MQNVSDRNVIAVNSLSMRGKDFEAYLLFKKEVNFVTQNLPAVVASQVYDYTLQDYVKPVLLY